MLVSSGLQLHALLSGHVHRPAYKLVSISGMRSRQPTFIFLSGTREGRRICIREGVPVACKLERMRAASAEGDAAIPPRF